MKDAELKNERKVFTRKEGRDIIKKDYNPLVDYKLICGREGLYMRKTEEGLLKEIIEELNFIERIFFRKKFIAVYKEGIKIGFNWNNSVR